LSGVEERPKIILMPTTTRPQRDDHRLRNLLLRTGDVTVATDLGAGILLVTFCMAPPAFARH
jgi:hypothetical protein